jgi:hypothetical protein
MRRDLGINVSNSVTFSPKSLNVVPRYNLRQRVEITSNLLELEGHVDAADIIVAIISALRGGCEQA